MRLRLVGAEEGTELAGTVRVAELAQDLNFDLADALASKAERLADFLERALLAVIEAVAQAHDFFLARGEGLEQRGGLFLEAALDDAVGGREHFLILDEIAQTGIVFADGSIERKRLTGDLEDLLHLLGLQAELAADFLGLGRAAHLLLEFARGASDLVERLDHVDGQADGAGLIGDGASNGLANPPGGVGGEFVAAAPIEFIDGAHEADVALLNQVEQVESSLGIFLGDGNHQAEVGLREFLFRLQSLSFAQFDASEGAMELGRGGTGALLELLVFLATEAEFAARFGGVLTLGLANAALDLLDFLLETGGLVAGLRDQGQQASLLGGGEIERTHEAAGLDDLTGKSRAGGAAASGVGFRDARELAGELVRGGAVLGDTIKNAQGLLRFLLELLFGDFFLIELHEIAHGTAMSAEILGGSEQFVPNKRGTRNDLEHAALATLDALGDDNFFFASEQASGTGFTQIHTYRVLGKFGPSRGGRDFQVLVVFGVFGLDETGSPVVMEFFMLVYAEQATPLFELILEFQHLRFSWHDCAVFLWLTISPRKPTCPTFGSKATFPTADERTNPEGLNRIRIFRCNGKRKRCRYRGWPYINISTYI
jgi:hypothetical protein